MKEYKRVEKVIENHERGYNCAQAVACAYCDIFGVDEVTTFRATEGFGRGMGINSICGAVAAMAYIAGLKCSDGQTDAPKTKLITYEAINRMVEMFKDMNKSVICTELKGVETGTPLRSCPGCMEDAAIIMEKILLKDVEY